MKKESRNRGDITGLTLIGFLVAFVIFIFIFIGVHIWYFNSLVNTFGYPRNNAEFGDMFGGLGSLLSSFSWSGVIITLLLQIRELSLQREESIVTENRLRDQDSRQDRLEEIQKELASISYLSILPTFEVHLGFRNSSLLKVETINISQFTAIDVEIFIALFDGTEANPKDVLTFDVRYSQFPGSRSVQRLLPFDSMRSITHIYVFIQYKSALGSNHHRIYVYDAGNRDDKDLRLIEARPASLEKTKRVRFSLESKANKNIWLDETKDEDFPDHLRGLERALNTLRPPVISEEALKQSRGFGDWQIYPPPKL